MKLQEFITEEYGYGLDVLKSFFSLAKTNKGKFKSQNQARYLLSKCDNGRFEIEQTLKFGEFGGASARVRWIVTCGNEGVDKIVKITSKGSTVYWDKNKPNDTVGQAEKKLSHKLELEKLLTHHEEAVKAIKEKYSTAIEVLSAMDTPEADAALKIVLSDIEEKSRPHLSTAERIRLELQK